MRRVAGAAVLALAALAGCSERGARSGERGTWSAERGARNAERGAELTTKAVPAPRPALPAPSPKPGTKPRPATTLPASATGFSFFVTANTHFGWIGMARANRRQVAAMNRLHTRTWPSAVGGGRVGRPLGVLVAGDLTQDGTRAQWAEFVAVYGRDGRDGLLRYPVFEGAGNHDSSDGRQHVAKAIQQRHGANRYAWWWRGVRFICLGRFPKPQYRRWLRRTLRAAGRKTPVVLYFHYNMVGPFSFMWDRKHKGRFAADIRGYNVVAIFHGHYHAETYYRWHGLDVYNVGASKHGLG